MKTRHLRIALLLATSTAVSANTELEVQQPSENTPAERYENLGLQNSETLHFTDEESAEMNRVSLEGFQKQWELSDPETKAALLKAQREIQDQKTKRTPSTRTTR